MYLIKLIKYEFITVYIRSHCWTELFRLSVQIAVKVGHLLLLRTCIYCFVLFPLDMLIFVYGELLHNFITLQKLCECVCNFAQ